MANAEVLDNGDGKKDIKHESEKSGGGDSHFSQALVSEPQESSILFKKMHDASKDSDSTRAFGDASVTQGTIAATVLIGALGLGADHMLRDNDTARFQRELPAADLSDTAKALLKSVGKVMVEKSDSSLPDTMVFKNPNVSLGDKLKVAMVEMQASGDRGWYIKHNGDELLIYKSDNPQVVEDRYKALEERRAASGVNYTVREIGFDSTSVKFPDGVDPGKATKAAVEEAKARYGSFSLDVNGQYLGRVDKNSNAETLKATYDSQLETKARNEAESRSNQEIADSMRRDLGYKISKSEYGGGFELKTSKAPEDSKVESIVQAAIQEAKARGQSVTIRFGDSYRGTTVDNSSNAEAKADDLRSKIKQEIADKESTVLRKSIEFQYTQNSLGHSTDNNIMFPPNTTPADRAKIAATEATRLDRAISFEYDGLKFSTGPGRDVKSVQEQYQKSWDEHFAKQQAEGKANLQEGSAELQKRTGYKVDIIAKKDWPDEVELSFSKKTLVADQIQAASFEARARNQVVQIKDGDNLIVVKPNDDAAKKAALVEDTKARAAEAGFTVTESSYDHAFLNFKVNTPIEKIVAASLAERDARRAAGDYHTDVIYRAGENVRGDLKYNDTFETAMAKYGQAKEQSDVWAQKAASEEAARAVSATDAAKLQEQLGYSIKKDDIWGYKMKVSPKVEIESAVDAAITEAKAKGASISMERAGSSVSVRADSNRDSIVDAYRLEAQRNSFEPQTMALRKQLGYELDYKGDGAATTLTFKAQTSAEDRITAAVNEAKFLKRTVQFKYDGMTSYASPSDDPEAAKAKYLQEYGSYKKAQIPPELASAAERPVSEERVPAPAASLDTVVKADIAKTVSDFGSTIGGDAASKHLFLSALGDDPASQASFKKLRDAAENDDERHTLDELRDRVRGLSPGERDAFRDGLLTSTERVTLGGGIRAVGITTGLLAVVSAAIYLAKESGSSKPNSVRKVPFFSPD